MVNKELIDLCRLVVAAIQDTDSFDARQLKKLLLHIVPQLLAEIDILAAVAASLSEKAEPEPEAPSVAAQPQPAASQSRRERRKKGKKHGRAAS